MHVIINILFYCKLRNIYGLKWTTTSKRSSPPRGREWKICLNMKVVKWVAARTGMFIKRSVKTGKTRESWTRFTHSTRFFCQCVCVQDVRMHRGNCAVISALCYCFCFHGRTSNGPPPNQRDVCFRSSRVHLFMCSCFHKCWSLHSMLTCIGVRMLRVQQCVCSYIQLYRRSCVH